MADDDPQAREQSRLLPGKRAEDAGWAVIVPDEAVRIATGYMRQILMSTGGVTLSQVDEYAESFARTVVAAAAPAIVAANQPKVEGDLRHVIQGALFNVSGLPDWYQKAALGRDFTPLVDRVLPAVEAHVAAQVAAAREEAEWLRNSRRDLITERDSLLAELRAKGGDRG